MRLATAGIALDGASATDLAEHRISNRLVLPAALACAALTLASGLNAATAVGLGLMALLSSSPSRSLAPLGWATSS